MDHGLLDILVDGKVMIIMDNKQNILKPCPFCGSAAHIWEDERFSNGGYNFPKWYIECLGCGIKTPTARMDQVVNIWNKRI